MAASLITPIMIAIAYGAALSPLVGAGIGMVGLALICFIIWRTSPVVAVGDRTFRVGSAHLPRRNVGDVHVITRQESDELLRKDGRYFTALRGSSPHVLVIDVNDLDDPHVGWLISLRRAAPFALALSQK
jgi:hypothetical protein